MNGDKPAPLFFADADSAPDQSDFFVIGAPYDSSSSYRKGAALGPWAIREASYNFETLIFEHDIDLANLRICDIGDTPTVGDYQELEDAVKELAGDAISDGLVPILLGGEHSVCVPLIELMAKEHTGLVVVIIDAHLDYRDHYLGDKNSHACTHRRIADVVGQQNCMSLGVRSISPEEWIEMKASTIDPIYMDAFTLRKEGMKLAIQEIERRWPDSKIHLSLDIDGIDPSFAPGTGTPEPFGLDPLDIKELINALGSRLVGMDITEVCPPFDNHPVSEQLQSGNTAALAARLVREAMVVIQKNRN